MKKNCIVFPSGMEWSDNTEQTKYEIVIPLQKETLRRRLKETTYPLCIENEAYRHQILSDFSNDCIRLKASAGIMKSNGILFEGTVIEEAYGMRIIGTFRILPRIKILTLLFLTAMAVAIFFIAGSSFPTIFFLLLGVGLCFYLYKHLETIFDTKSGDERIFQYIREELNGMIVKKQCKK